MPYIKESNFIHTKITGTTMADDTGNRQALLKDIKEGNLKVKFLYAEQDIIKAVIIDPNGQNREISLGKIKEEYVNIISKTRHMIKSYTVTGGYKLENNSNSKKPFAYYGLNISIQLFPENTVNEAKINI